MGHKEVAHDLLSAVHVSIPDGDVPPAEVIEVLRVFLANATGSTLKGAAIDAAADALIDAWKPHATRGDE